MQNNRMTDFNYSVWLLKYEFLCILVLLNGPLTCSIISSGVLLPAISYRGYIYGLEVRAWTITSSVRIGWYTLQLPQSHCTLSWCLDISLHITERILATRTHSPSRLPRSPKLQKLLASRLSLWSSSGTGISLRKLR